MSRLKSLLTWVIRVVAITSLLPLILIGAIFLSARLSVNEAESTYKSWVERIDLQKPVRLSELTGKAFECVTAFGGYGGKASQDCKHRIEVDSFISHNCVVADGWTSLAFYKGGKISQIDLNNYTFLTAIDNVGKIVLPKGFAPVWHALESDAYVARIRYRGIDYLVLCEKR